MPAMHTLPRETEETIDIVRFLAMDARDQLALVFAPEAAAWVKGNPKPLGSLLANFDPYPGMFDNDPGDRELDDAHELLMELITSARIVDTDDGPPDDATFNRIEWQLLRRLARLTLAAFRLERQKPVRTYLFEY